jgi:Uma2 family endonuclease
MTDQDVSGVSSMATSTLRIGPADHGRAMTLQEFKDAEETPGYRYELARGILEVTELPDEPHALIEWFLIGRLQDYERNHLGVFYRVGSSDTTRIWLPGMVSSRGPDLAIVLPKALKDRYGRRIPSMTIEIVSEGQEARDRDYITKRQKYLAFGLREYWIVDRFARRVTVLLRDGDAWVERIFENDATAKGLTLPGFTIRLSDLWAAAEQADDEEPADA